MDTNQAMPSDVRYHDESAGGLTQAGVDAGKFDTRGLNNALLTGIGGQQQAKILNWDLA